MNRSTLPLLAAAAVALFSCRSSEAPPDRAAVRVGTYDGRAVVVALGVR